MSGIRTFILLFLVATFCTFGSTQDFFNPVIGGVPDPKDVQLVEKLKDLKIPDPIDPQPTDPKPVPDGIPINKDFIPEKVEVIDIKDKIEDLS